MTTTIDNNIKKGIAHIAPPVRFSLASNPNYVTLRSTIGSNSTFISIKLKVASIIEQTNEEMLAKTPIITITQKSTESSTPYSFYGTWIKSKLNSNTFMLNHNRAITAENIRACLLKNPFLRGNYTIVIPPIGENSTIVMTAKGVGERYTFLLSLNAMIVKSNNDTENNASNDSIRGANSNCEIELDIYTKTGLKPGEIDDTKMGTPMATLSKAYTDQELWFDLNTMLANQNRYSNAFLNALGWCDAGTVTDIRFVAKRFDGANHEVFHVSDVAYALNGYVRNLEENNLEKKGSNYVFDTVAQNEVLPLTLQPVATHIKGQSQYFNFVMANNHNRTMPYNLLYALHTQSGNRISEQIGAKTERKASDFDVANTIKLDLDQFLNNEQVGIIKVYLASGKTKLSRALTFHILPQCLHKVNDFAFLNSLGGWSSFNFGGGTQSEFKAKGNSIFHTQTPHLSISDEIEKVYAKQVEEQYVVETAPIHATTAHWLKELSTSPAVYELLTKRYVIVDDLTVKHNSKDDLFVLQMKFHYSDSYNAML